MKIRQLFTIILVIMIVIMGTGCPGETNVDPAASFSDLYDLTKNSNQTYSYTFSDLYGNILYQRENTVREPKILQASAYTYGFVTQAGTGLSTNWAVFCDAENSRISEEYSYVLTAQDNIVVHCNYEDEKHMVILQDIFEKNHYYQEYILENVSPVAADFVIDGYFDDEGNVVITYLSGENYTKTEYTIVIS